MIRKTVLVLSQAFDERLDADAVAETIGRGLATDGCLVCDLCPLEESSGQRDGSTVPADTATASADATVLKEADFDVRMRAARALVIAWMRLDDRSLPGSIAFEAATRARQGGVPCYAVTAHDELDPFEARIVDLQVILEARSSRALSAAGRKLATLL